MNKIIIENVWCMTSGCGNVEFATVGMQVKSTETCATYVLTNKFDMRAQSWGEWLRYKMLGTDEDKRLREARVIAGMDVKTVEELDQRADEFAEKTSQIPNIAEVFDKLEADTKAECDKLFPDRPGFDILDRLMDMYIASPEMMENLGAGKQAMPAEMKAMVDGLIGKDITEVNLD